jgi:hypothetical protein
LDLDVRCQRCRHVARQTTQPDQLATLETGYALKQLSQAGVRVFSYLDGREVALETAMDKFLMSAVSFAADVEREKARQRTHDAMERKARAGHATGGRVFGYGNHEVHDAIGKRSHVELRVNQKEAAVVVRIFELFWERCRTTDDCKDSESRRRFTSTSTARTASRLVPVVASRGSSSRVVPRHYGVEQITKTRLVGHQSLASATRVRMGHHAEREPADRI